MSKQTDPAALSAYERWELPHVQGKNERATAQELQDVHKRAYDEGFALGKAVGMEEGKLEAETNLNALKNILAALSEPLSQLDDEIVGQLSSLSMLVAKQVIRRELRTTEGEIIGVVREAVNALPASARKVMLRVNPEDAELIRNAFSLDKEQDDSDELMWSITEDPILTRGGCIIKTENSYIDATVEERINRVIATLLGGERQADES